MYGGPHLNRLYRKNHGISTVLQEGVIFVTIFYFLLSMMLKSKINLDHVERTLLLNKMNRKVAFVKTKVPFYAMILLDYPHSKQ